MKIILFIVHHTLLYIYAKTIALIYYIKYSNKMLDSHEYEKYINKKREYDYTVCNLDSLCNYFRRRKGYKLDGYKGLFHHYNSDEEFYLSGYDCEDVAWRAKRKLEGLGYQTQVIGMIGEKVNSWHYDLIIDDVDEYYLFNYGKLITGGSIKECLDKKYKDEKYIWWRCYW
jgi:hypothetical protein